MEEAAGLSFPPSLQRERSARKEKRREGFWRRDARDEDDIPETTPTSSLDSGPTDRETDDGRLLPSQPPQAISFFFPIILVTPSPESPRGLWRGRDPEEKRGRGRKVEEEFPPR
ncbi:hypothetical protein CDAR_445131 [Caerostris darwini]|uniref:Uncharacterized protein n=1 Tax=Caerostris darwini TaxID=1538125 RepID=A0AAV4SBJ1_9ARAC|nr:hypothetical protein CDAR_445131 [Caerostris darwini]